MEIDENHRFLILRNRDRAYVGSTDDLGERLPDGHQLVDTIGEDGLGTVNGSLGIADFLRAKKGGRRP